MMGQASGAISTPFRCLVTQEGNHTPEAWARETSIALVSIDRETTPERQKLAEALRNKIYARLIEHFQQVKPNMLTSELQSLSRSATGAVFWAAKGSPWEFQFSQPDIRAAMTSTIMRNIETAADLAVRTE